VCCVALDETAPEPRMNGRNEEERRRRRRIPPYMLYDTRGNAGRRHKQMAPRGAVEEILPVLLPLPKCPFVSE
jgi:hypothetical protein